MFFATFCDTHVYLTFVVEVCTRVGI